MEQEKGDLIDFFSRDICEHMLHDEAIYAEDKAVIRLTDIDNPISGQERMLVKRRMDRLEQTINLLREELMYLEHWQEIEREKRTDKEIWGKWR